MNHVANENDNDSRESEESVGATNAAQATSLVTSLSDSSPTTCRENSATIASADLNPFPKISSSTTVKDSQDIEVHLLPPGVIPNSSLSPRTSLTTDSSVANTLSTSQRRTDVSSIVPQSNHQHHPIVGELAPNPNEMASQLAIQMLPEWQERVQQEVQTQLQTRRQRNQVIVHAEEEPPKQKEPWKMVVVLCSVAIIVAIVVTVLSTRGDDISRIRSLAPSMSNSYVPSMAPTSTPTQSPTSYRRKYLMDTLAPQLIINDSVDTWALWEDPSTPQAQALRWLSEEDQNTLILEIVKQQVLLERYIMAVLYFSTSGPQWSNTFPFLDPFTSVCYWHFYRDVNSDTTKGIFCSGSGINYGLIDLLYLRQSGLSGTIPWELSLLENLRDLFLENNYLTGPIPFHGGDRGQRQESLRQVELTQNLLSGTLPSEWGDRMPGLTGLFLERNYLTGSIPAEWGSWESLHVLDLRNNELDGSIPTTLGHLLNMTDLYLNNNALSGTLPGELGNLTNLSQLRVDGNTELRGTVPSQFSNLSGLYLFHFSGTSLTGSVDDLFCDDGEREEMVVNFMADCLGENATMECSCCQYCCVPADNEEWVVDPTRSCEVMRSTRT